jgi:V8-like Glu-specific endopeptidase
MKILSSNITIVTVIKNGITRLVAGLVAFLLALAAFAQIEAQASPVAVKSLGHESARQVKKFWTVERMQAAEPSKLDASVIPSTTEDLPQVAAGEPTMVPSQGITGPTRRSSLISDPTGLPYRLHGKIFFQARDFNGVWDDYVCSGTVVNSPSKRVVFTAGHCVFESFWSRRLVFVPGYHDGVEPYGEFAARRITAPARWVKYEWSRPTYALSYDVGAVVLKGATPVQTAVGGARGIAFNVGRSHEYTSFGYPAGFPFDGLSLVTCSGTFGGRDPGTFSPSPGWIPCDMTGGSSGGGWIFDNEFLNSVNSYAYGNSPTRMYGPYFGNVIKRLYTSVKNG